jgi:S1-C subfamily serine protease
VAPDASSGREDVVSSSLVGLSAELSGLVEANAPSVVRIEGRRRSASSGVVWSADGLIVASHHAVDADEQVPVGLHDGRSVAAKVVGRDPGSDLALLRTDASGLQPPRWSDGGTRKPGELVLALSRPGRSTRARLGVLSAVAADWRSPSGTRFESYLETDVALHPGFSGGLLLAADGTALGVNSSGLLRGASVAVPAAVVKRVAEALLAHGSIRRGYLGIGTQPVALTPDLRSSTGQGAALIVLSVQPDSPAARGGLRLGDVLLKAGDETLTHPGALVPSLDPDKVGRELRLSVLRAGEGRELVVVVGERPAA